MKLPTGLGLMVMGVLGVARGAAGESSRHTNVAAHTPHLAALVGAFLFVGGLMLVAKRDAFAPREPRHSGQPDSPKTD